MIAAAGLTARKYKCSKRETDDVAFLRYEQYFQAKASGFLDRVLVPLDILDVAGRPLGRIDDDFGVRKLTLGGLRAQRELDTCVTGGTQTHASDGMACLLVTTKERVADLSTKPEIDIQFIAKTEVRAGPSLMPEAPGLAVQKLLDMTGLSMADITVAKNHNPFAVNDVIFAQQLEYDWKEMNKTGCPLVWGHPQGPTLTRVIIEGLEEAVDLGGGYVLVFGCAAGDVGIAATNAYNNTPSVNGQPTHTYPRVPEKGDKQWPFNQPFYFILSMQIGGKWVNGSGPTDPAHYPASMAVDWVRVYSRKTEPGRSSPEG
jgi:acetyl-CoA acetyltransferase